MNRCRERWVHQHDTGHDAGIQVVVDVRGVKPGRGDGGKKVAKNAGTALGKLVENERGAGEFSEDGKKAGAGRRLQNDVGGGDRGSDAGDVCQSDRRGELLEGFTFLGPTCLCRKEARNPQQHRQHGGRRRRLGAHGGAIPSQEQDGRRLAGVIGRLPVPGASRIGGANAASMALRRTAASTRRPRSRSVKSWRAALTTAEATTAVARIESGTAAPPMRDSVMGGISRRAGMGRAARRSPKTAAAQTLPGPALPLPAILLMRAGRRGRGEGCGAAFAAPQR